MPAAVVEASEPASEAEAGPIESVLDRRHRSDRGQDHESAPFVTPSHPVSTTYFATYRFNCFHALYFIAIVDRVRDTTLKSDRRNAQ